MDDDPATAAEIRLRDNENRVRDLKASLEERRAQGEDVSATEELIAIMEGAIEWFKEDLELRRQKR
jgi:hypothetical protein